LFSRKSRFKPSIKPNENQRNNYYTGTNGTSRLREDFDNVGLLVGDQESDATGILVCHDALRI
jgi:hypothetical protein